MRASGEPYVVHCVEVARMLAVIGRSRMSARALMERWPGLWMV
jgi:(p)ppGpp synthase/HD superfamily hydrolase